jgi:hypothetical protein
VLFGISTMLLSHNHSCSTFGKSNNAFSRGWQFRRRLPASLALSSAVKPVDAPHHVHNVPHPNLTQRLIPQNPLRVALSLSLEPRRILLVLRQTVPSPVPSTSLVQPPDPIHHPITLSISPGTQESPNAPTRSPALVSDIHPRLNIPYLLEAFPFQRRWEHRRR